MEVVDETEALQRFFEGKGPPYPPTPRNSPPPQTAAQRAERHRVPAPPQGWGVGGHRWGVPHAGERGARSVPATTPAKTSAWPPERARAPEGWPRGARVVGVTQTPTHPLRSGHRSPKLRARGVGSAAACAGGEMAPLGSGRSLAHWRWRPAADPTPPPQRRPQASAVQPRARTPFGQHASAGRSLPSHRREPKAVFTETNGGGAVVKRILASVEQGVRHGCAWRLRIW